MVQEGAWARFCSEAAAAIKAMSEQVSGLASVIRFILIMQGHGMVQEATWVRACSEAAAAMEALFEQVVDLLVAMLVDGEGHVVVQEGAWACFCSEAAAAMEALSEQVSGLGAEGAWACAKRGAYKLSAVRALPLSQPAQWPSCLLCMAAPHTRGLAHLCLLHRT